MREGLISICLLSAVACGGQAVPAEEMLGLDEKLAPPELTEAGMDAWLAKGLYRMWPCEAAPQQRGTHQLNRICNNSLLAGGTPPFPRGATSVKELHQGDRVIGYAVHVRLGEGDGGARRYWYEKINGRVPANGKGAAACTGCHDNAPEDFTYLRVR